MQSPLLTRRRLLTGLLAAPIVVTTPGLLMKVKVPVLMPGGLVDVRATREIPTFSLRADSHGIHKIPGLPMFEHINFQVFAEDAPAVGQNILLQQADVRCKFELTTYVVDQVVSA